MEEEIKIRGEYWIVDGQVDFADGDIGDRNHEYIATEHVFSSVSDNVLSLAQDLDIDVEDFDGFEGVDIEAIQNTINQIEEKYEEELGSAEAATAKIIQELGIDEAKYLVLWGRNQAKDYVVQYEGWIAVRDNNVDVWGLDNQKRKEIANGIWEILSEEGHEYESVNPELVELWIEDFKTKKSVSATLAELEGQTPIIQSQQPATTKYNNFNISFPDAEENKPVNPNDALMKNKMIPPKKWNNAAQQQKIVGPGQQLWRGTSENRMPDFLEWISKK